MPDPTYQIIVPENFDTILALAGLSIIAGGLIYQAVRCILKKEYLALFNFLDTSISREKEGELVDEVQSPQAGTSKR